MMRQKNLKNLRKNVNSKSIEKHISVSETKQPDTSSGNESTMSSEDEEQIVPAVLDAIVQTTKYIFHVKITKSNGNCLFSDILSFLDKNEAADQSEI